MAEAKVVLTAKDKTKKAIASADAGLRRLNRSAGVLKANFAGLAGTFLAARSIVGTVQTYRDFSKTVSNLGAITGITGKELKKLSDQSREMGASTTLSASQAAEAFKIVASAKPDLIATKTGLQDVTKATITLAEAASIDMPSAARALTLALNQYGEGAESATKFIDVLAAGAKKGSSEIAETAEALKSSGLVARTAGTSFVQLNAAIQTLAISGIKASEAGVGLRNIYLNLAKQSNTKFNPAIVGLQAAMDNLKKAQLSEIELLAIFGKKNIVAAKALITQSSKLKQLTKDLDVNGIALEQQSVNTDNLDGDIKRLGSAFEELQISIGESADGGLRKFTKSLTEMLTPGTKANEIAIKLGKGLMALVAVKAVSVVFAAIRAQAILMSLSFKAASFAALTLRTAIFPLGAILTTVITAISLFGAATVKTKEKTSDLKKELKELTGTYAELEKAKYTERMSELSLEIEKQTSVIEKLSEVRNRRIRGANRLERIQARREQLALENEKLAEQVKLYGALNAKRNAVKDPASEQAGDPDKLTRMAAEQQRREAATIQAGLVKKLETTRLALRTETEVINEAYANRQMIIDNYALQANANDQFAAQLAVRNEAQKQQALTDLARQGIDEREKQEKMARHVAFSMTMQAMAALAASMDTNNRKEFEKQKKINIAIAMINMFKGISQSLGAYPMPWAAIIAAAHGVIGLSNVKRIKQQQFGGSGGGGGLNKPSIPNIGGGAGQTQPAVPFAQPIPETQKRVVELRFPEGRKVFNDEDMREFAEQFAEGLGDMGTNVVVAVQ